MAEIRLSKLTKQYSIGLKRLVEFLNERGAWVEMNPNAKISDEYLPMIEAQFGEEQKLKKDSEKVIIKLKEIIKQHSENTPSQDFGERANPDDVRITEIIPQTGNTYSIETNPSHAQVSKTIYTDNDSIEMDFNWEID